MAGTNDFLPFAVGGSANVEAQATWVAETTLLANGFQSGVAESAKFNKALRQSSIIAAAVAQFIANSGPNVVDDGTTSTIVTNLTAAINSMITAGGIKQPVRAATTANVATLAGGAPNTLDGVTLAANDRILVKDQSTASQNGIYVVTTLGTGANGTWARATDSDGVGELYSGMLVVVQEGTANADGIFELSTDGAITIGTTSLTFTRKDSVSGKQLQSVSASVASNALTLGLGANSLDFRSPTLTTGAPNTRSFSALSLVVPSGATLGTVSGQSARLALIAIDNAGTVELAVANLAGGANLDETTLISTTAISGTSNSAGVIYSTTARSNVPFRFAGFIDISEATAGTWATAPTLVQGAGGQALAALSAVGYGQAWQSVTRNASTTYYNATGKPIQLNILLFATTATLTIGGVSISLQGASNAYTMYSFILPPGTAYSYTGTIQAAYELR